MAAHRRLSDDVTGDVVKVAVIEGLMPHVVHEIYISIALTVMMFAAMLYRHIQRVKGHENDGRCPECGRDWDGRPVNRVN